MSDRAPEETSRRTPATIPLTSIAVRLPLLVVGALLLLIIITGVAGSTISRLRLINLVQDNLETLAVLQASQAEQQLSQHLSTMENLSQRLRVQNQLKAAQVVYRALDQAELETRLAEREALWLADTSRDDYAASPNLLIVGVRTHGVSIHELIPEKHSLLVNLGIESDFLLTDMHGAVISGSYIPRQYLFNRETWWREARERDALYIGGPVPDPDNPARQILEFALPVRDQESGDFLGVLYSSYGYAAIQETVSRPLGENSYSTLINSAGEITAAAAGSGPLIGVNVPLEESGGSLYTVVPPEGDAFVITTAPLISPVSAINNLSWHIGAVQPRVEALAPVNEAIIPALLLASSIGLVIVAILYAGYIRPLTIDLNKLRETAQALQKGSLHARAKVKRNDELGLLSDTFDQMAQNLYEQIQTREQTIARRTADLQKQTRQLQAAAEIGRSANASLDQATLMANAVNAIRRAFDFYHVAIFLLDEKSQTLVVREATGQAGRLMKEKPHKLAVGSDSIVGWVAENRQPRNVENTARDAVHFNNPLLPDTHSEAGLPLITQQELLGVLDVQSVELAAISEEDISALQLIADQIATAIYNARLYGEVQARLKETEALFNFTDLLTTTLDVPELYRRAARATTELLNASACAFSSWDEERNRVTTEIEFIHDDARGIIDEYDFTQVHYDLAHHSGTQRVLQEHIYILRHVDDPELEESERQILQETGQTFCLELPLVAGNQALGIVELYRTREQPAFTEREIRLAQAIAKQAATALNNAILTTEARSRVAQLSTLNRLSQALSLAPDMPAIFNSAQPEILSLVDATGMRVALLDAAQSRLEWLYAFDYGSVIDPAQLPATPVGEGLAGYIIQTSQPILIPQFDEQTYAQHNLPAPDTLEIASYLGLPLKVAQQTIGVLEITNGDESDAFDAKDMQLISTIANAMAISLQNQQLLDQMQQALLAQSEQSLRLSAAAEVSTAISSILDLEELMQTAVDLIQQRFALYYVGLFLVDDAGKEAVLRAGTGEAGRIQLRQGHRLPIDNHSLIGGAIAAGQSQIMQELKQEEGWRPNPVLPDTQSELALPLRVRGQIIGALTVQSTEANEFGSETVSALQTMCDQIASAIDSAQLLAESQARADREQALNEVSARLHRTADVEEIIGIGLKAISQQLDGAKVSVRLGQAAINRGAPAAPEQSGSRNGERRDHDT